MEGTAGTSGGKMSAPPSPAYGLQQPEELFDRPGQLLAGVGLVGTRVGTTGRAGLGLPTRNRLAKRARGVRVDIGERQVANPTTRIVFELGCGSHFELIACPLRLDRISDPLEHDDLRQAGVVSCCGSRLLLVARGHAVA